MIGWQLKLILAHIQVATRCAARLLLTIHESSRVGLMSTQQRSSPLQRFVTLNSTRPLCVWNKLNMRCVIQGPTRKIFSGCAYARRVSCPTV
ncbi:hypothetical protein F5Y07DRAFT_378302 [Xylaria sp. FL0933]|nr:hypothetical protein F5Y07DRAFT_378302 [Xylaria sp. FL0933]